MLRSIYYYTYYYYIYYFEVLLYEIYTIIVRMYVLLYTQSIYYSFCIFTYIPHRRSTNAPDPKKKKGKKRKGKGTRPPPPGTPAAPPPRHDVMM